MTTESGSRPSEDGLRSDRYSIAQASIVSDVRSLLAGWRRFERTDDETLKLIAECVGYYLAPSPSQAQRTCEFSRGNRDCTGIAVSVIEMPPNAPKGQRYACEEHTAAFKSNKIPPPIRMLDNFERETLGDATPPPALPSPVVSPEQQEGPNG